MATEMATASKCISKKVACLLIKDGRILSTGINGAVKGKENCCDHFINHPKRYSGKPDSSLMTLSEPLRSEHHAWSTKHEIHAEQNAIIWAAREGISIKGASCYCTLQPCWNCLKMLAAAGIENVYYKEVYDMNSSSIGAYNEYVRNNFNKFEEING